MNKLMQQEVGFLQDCTDWQDITAVMNCGLVTY